MGRCRDVHCWLGCCLGCVSVSVQLGHIHTVGDRDVEVLGSAHFQEDLGWDGATSMVWST